MNSREVALNIINRVLIEGAYSNLVLSNELNEVDGAKKVLGAAAMTYVAAALMSITQLLRLIALSNRNND